MMEYIKFTKYRIPKDIPTLLYWIGPYGSLMGDITDYDVTTNQFDIASIIIHNEEPSTGEIVLKIQNGGTYTSKDPKVLQFDESGESFYTFDFDKTISLVSTTEIPLLRNMNISVIASGEFHWPIVRLKLKKAAQ